MKCKDTQADNQRPRTDSLHTSPSAQSLEATARTMSVNGWPTMTDFWNSAENCRGKQWKRSPQHNLYLENPRSPFSSVLSFIRDIWLRESSLFEIRSIWPQRTAFLFCLKHARFLCTQRLYAEESMFYHNIYASSNQLLIILKLYFCEPLQYYKKGTLRLYSQKTINQAAARGLQFCNSYVKLRKCLFPRL